MSKGRDDECLIVLSNLRRQPPDSPLVQLEYLEVKAQYLFEQRTSQENHPGIQDGSFSSNFKLGFYGYASLLTNRSLFKRLLVAVFIMVFQQCKLARAGSRSTY
jgi:hypothetical protein